MPRRTDIVLVDVLETIAGIEAAINGQTQASLHKNWFLQRGLERGLEIISEAIRHIPEDLLITQPHIAWVDIRAIGNLIRHEYHRVDPDMIWSVVCDDLPALKLAVERMQRQQKD